MRRLPLVLAVASALGVGCSGDSSSLISVWSDAGATAPTGGVVASGGAGASIGGASGGQIALGRGGGNGGVATYPVVSTGGIAGQGGAPSSVFPVPGGLRDVATGQCVAASGGGCYVPSDQLTCPKTTCGSDLGQCYSTNSTGQVIGGVCRAYADCLRTSPCDASQDAYEMACLQNYGIGSTACLSCLVKLAACMSSQCPTTSTICTSGGSAGAGGSSGYWPTDASVLPYPADAGPAFSLDARIADVRVISPPDVAVWRDTRPLRPDAIVYRP